MDSLHHSARVRFAPSPTGALHVGGARTALFNFLFARHTGGKFLLRIEDTDISRSREELSQQIMRSLRWLGLEWDEDPVFQSGSRERHVESCRILLETGKAYPCFCDAETLKQKRERAVREKGEYRYDGTCRSIPREEAAARIDRGESHTIRFKVPEGNTSFQDAVRGTVNVDHSQIGDFVLLRSDRTPVYQVAVVVDDHDMGISHVVRGDDHLSNTPKQILLYKALNWKIPFFAHVPMILGSDKKRLSKRHGAASVEEYRDQGYLPEALVNFLALLSWSPGDDRELMTLSEMIESFSLERISSNPAVFEETKLEWMNSQYIMKESEKQLLERLSPLLEESGLADRDYIEKNRDYLITCIGLMHQRMKTLRDFPDNGKYFFHDPENYDEKAVRKIWHKEGAPRRLEQLYEKLSDTKIWNRESLEKLVNNMAEKQGVGLGKILQPARLAVTGSSASPGMFELMEVLGKETTLCRLQKAISYLGRHEKDDIG